MAATAHVRVAEHAGVEAEPLPECCTVKEVEGGGAEDPACVVFFMDDAVSVEVHWEPDGGRCLALAQSLALIHFQAMGARVGGEDPLLSHKKVTDWAPQQEVVGFDQDTGKKRRYRCQPGRSRICGSCWRIGLRGEAR